MTKITMIIDVVNYNYDDGDDVAFLSDVTMYGFVVGGTRDKALRTSACMVV